MDLDQFKQRWQQASTSSMAPRTKFRTILRRPKQGPVASLKRNFRRQIIILLLVFLLFLRQLGDRNLFHNVFFDWFLVCGGCLCIFFYINLRLVRKLEKTEDVLTDHVRRQVSLLEQRMRWHRLFTRVAIATLILLLEILPYFSSERMLNKWHAISPFMRIAAYAGLLLFQHYIGRLIAHRRYGRHLERLKQILNDTV